MLKRLLLVVGLTGVLFAAWNWSVLMSLIRPTLVRQGIVVTDAAIQEQLAPNTVAYPSLGIQAPITVDAGTSPLLQSDWTVIRQSLRQGVSLAYDGDVFVDARLAFLTGHSSDYPRHDYDSVFASLGQAAIGDTLRMNIEGTEYQYRVTVVQELSPTNADAFLALTPTHGPSRLALVTCWPPLTTKMRMVVLAERL